jgi:hypothetical protein
VPDRPEVIEEPDHPGKQCHDAHPGRPHRVIAPRTNTSQAPPPAPQRALPPMDPDGGRAAPGRLLGALPDPDWSHWKEYAERALEFSGAAVAAARSWGEAHKGQSEIPWCPEAQALNDAARIAADLAASASPYSMGMPMPSIDLQFGGL